MKKWHGWLVFFLVIFLDLLSKEIVIRWGDVAFAGPFGLGAILGDRTLTQSLSLLPLPVKNVLLLTLCGFFIFIHFVAGLLAPVSLNRLFFGLSLLMAGLTASCLDHNIHSAITSLFLLGYPDAVIYHFGISDIASLAGILLTGYWFHRSYRIIFPKFGWKRSYWVDPKFQTKYSLIIAGLGASYAVIIGFFCFSFFRATLMLYQESAAGADLEGIEKDWIIAFIVGFFLITSLYLAILLAFARRMTHAVAGPVYAFDRVARDLMAGKEAKLRLREGDEFKYLNTLAEDLTKALSPGHRRE